MITKDQNVKIPKNAMVTVTVMNHIIEVMHMERRNRKATIKKLDKHTYIKLSTGELKEFNHSENREQNLNSLRQSFKKIREIINSNFEGKPNEKHLILTYKENMTDHKKLYADLKKFVMALKYHFKDKTTIDYFTVPEPQGRGAWHAHMLLRFNQLESVWLPDELLKRIWTHGFSKTKALAGVDNIGAYLSAYLSDVELTQENFMDLEFQEVKVKNVEGHEKRFAKGARLHMYPPGMNLFRRSRGIVDPLKLEISYESVKKKIVESATPHYSQRYVIEHNDFSNVIQYEQYNTKRKIDTCPDLL